MNHVRVVLAALASLVVYFALGALLFAGGTLKREFAKFPTSYRSKDSMKATLPYGIGGMLLAMLALSVLFAYLRPEGTVLAQGLRFGALIGAFAVGSFVLHNYVNLNIGLRLTAGQAIAYFVQWVVVGLVIAWVYKPA